MKYTIGFSKNVASWQDLLGSPILSQLDHGGGFSPLAYDEWCPIDYFDDYSVSDSGIVRNDYSGRIMTAFANQHGIVHVGLTKDQKLYKRGVALLVAKAFLLRRQEESFDTPINLDGDRSNNRSRNLAWRPRWFATEYFRQFKQRRIPNDYQVEDMETGEFFENPWDAAIKFGLLYNDLVLRAYDECEVWPTQQRFRLFYEHSCTSRRY